MTVKHVTLITALSAALVAGAPTAFAQEQTVITIAAPANGATVSRNFDLRGTVSRGGGALQLKIDGLSYLPTSVRSDSGSITEGVNFGETSDGATNVPFSLAVDLNGSTVVSSGGTNRQPVGDGSHRLQVCQVFGPVSGCSPVVTVTVSEAAAQSSTTTAAPTATPTPTPSPTLAPAAVKGSQRTIWLLAVLAAILIGGGVGYGIPRLARRK